MMRPKRRRYLAQLEASLATINPSVAQADRQFPGCNDDNFCIYCNAVQLKHRASFQKKFGCHGPKCYADVLRPS